MEKNEVIGYEVADTTGTSGTPIEEPKVDTEAMARSIAGLNRKERRVWEKRLGTKIPGMRRDHLP